ncbi:MAG: hypothetical protein R3C45_17940 [Phycisphaerales bacterium]
MRRDSKAEAPQYPYPDRPIREPVIDQVHRDGRVVAAITRNGYGALVLNTSDVMFIDIDAPEVSGGWGLLRRKQGWAVGELLQTTAAKLNTLAESDPLLGFRLYQTAAGLRVLVTGRTFDPVSDESDGIMTKLNADPRYMQLCRMQACFRARLTPKPWRCGVPRSPWTFPYPDDRRREDFEAWQRQYERAASGYAVCQPVASIGAAEPDDGTRPILIWHDELACSEGLPLA